MNGVEPVDFLIVLTFLASVGATIVLVLAIWGGVLLLRILWDLQHIARRIRIQSDRIVDDVGAFRTGMKEAGARLVHEIHACGIILSTILKMVKRKK